MQGKTGKSLKRSIPLLIMFLPVIAVYVIFRYLPMFGIVMAFQDYNIADGFIGSPFVGLKYFKIIFSTPATRQVIKNTFYLGVTSFVLGIPFPIIMALIINDIHNVPFKKFAQTCVYLPHFLSWVIVGGMVTSIFSQGSGFINAIIKGITGAPYPFLYKNGSWLAIFFGSAIWKETGFAAIIYIAALAGVDPELYDAASIDGAGKFRKIIHINFPALVPTITINMILSMGNVINVGFDQIYNLTNPTVNRLSDVISTYVYRVGLQQFQFSLTSAMGLFQSLLGVTLIIITNWFARRTENSLW
jgi:putative aldouronate transport system permease protein